MKIFFILSKFQLYNTVYQFYLLCFALYVKILFLLQLKMFAILPTPSHFPQSPASGNQFPSLCF